MNTTKDNPAGAREAIGPRLSELALAARTLETSIVPALRTVDALETELWAEVKTHFPESADDFDGAFQEFWYSLPEVIVLHEAQKNARKACG